MDAPILTTKLFIPKPRQDLISRPRLFEKLNAGLDKKLTLISAPAGFGKSTLLSDWIHQSEEDVVWFSLDKGDNDQARLFTYLIAALNKAEVIKTPVGRGVLEMLKSPQPPSYVDILTALVNEVVALSGNIILVLDDYHLIDSSPIDKSLTFLLENQPQNLHLMIATRDDPQLPLARLRARGQLSELRAADLRFTSSEAAKFLKNGMGLSLSAEDIDALESRTEGWIVGLQLAAISLQGLDDPSTHIKSFTGSHRFVLDYLIEEVLDQQPESVQGFLLQTSILNRLNGSLCDALTGQKNAQGILESLEHANLFIMPLDEKRFWYRYHHLFSDLLRQRLSQTQPDLVLTLHIRASKWYEKNGFPDEAIEHALNAKDFNRTANLIEEQADNIWERGEHTKLRRWLERLPVDLVFSNPQLCILQAWRLFVSGQQELAERYLQAAEQVLAPSIDRTTEISPKERYQQSGPDWLKLRGRVATIRAFLAVYRGDVQGTLQHAHQALEYLPEQDYS